MTRIALYSHDAQGLGHLDTLALPALRKDSDGSYRARSLGIDRDAILRMRTHVLRAALREFAPDVLVADKLARGVGGELAESFGVLRAMGTRLVLGMREVLDEPVRVRADWRRDDTHAALRRHYDAIWVYGDRRVYDPVAEYEIPDDIAELVRHSGYLGAGRPEVLADGGPELWRRRLALPDGPLYVCMVGGGEDGYRLADVFARARLPGGSGVIVAGPFMPEAQRRAIAEHVARRDDLHMLEFTSEASALIWLADRVISMGGYNTTCEILSSGTPALVVPRVHPRREQVIRARRLRDLGALELLMPAALSPTALSAWLAAPAPARRRPAIDLDGLRRLPAMLADILASSARDLPAALPSWRFDLDAAPR